MSGIGQNTQSEVDDSLPFEVTREMPSPLTASYLTSANPLVLATEHAARDVSHYRLKAPGYHLYQTSYTSPFLLPHSFPPGSKLYTGPAGPFMKEATAGYLVIPSQYDPREVAADLESAAFQSTLASSPQHYALSSFNPSNVSSPYGLSSSQQYTSVLQPLVGLNVPTVVHTPNIPAPPDYPITPTAAITSAAAGYIALRFFARNATKPADIFFSVSPWLHDLTKHFPTLARVLIPPSRTPQNILTSDIVSSKVQFPSLYQDPQQFGHALVAQLRESFNSTMMYHIPIAMAAIDFPIAAALTHRALVAARTDAIMRSDFGAGQDEQQSVRHISLTSRPISPLIITHSDPQHSLHPSSLAFTHQAAIRFEDISNLEASRQNGSGKGVNTTQSSSLSSSSTSIDPMSPPNATAALINPMSSSLLSMDGSSTTSALAAAAASATSSPLSSSSSATTSSSDATQSWSFAPLVSLTAVLFNKVSSVPVSEAVRDAMLDNAEQTHSTVCNVAVDVPQALPTHANYLFDVFSSKGDVVSATTGQTFTLEQARAEGNKNQRAAQRQYFWLPYMPNWCASLTKQHMFGLLGLAIGASVLSKVTVGVARTAFAKLYNRKTLIYRNIAIKHAASQSLTTITPTYVNNMLSQQLNGVFLPTISKLGKFSQARIVFAALWSTYMFKQHEQQMQLQIEQSNQQKSAQVTSFRIENDILDKIGEGDISLTQQLFPDNSLLRSAQHWLQKWVETRSFFVDRLNAFDNVLTPSGTDVTNSTTAQSTNVNAVSSEEVSTPKTPSIALYSEQDRAYARLVKQFITVVCQGTRLQPNVQRSIQDSWVPPSPSPQTIATLRSALEQYVSAPLPHGLVSMSDIHHYQHPSSKDLLNMIDGSDSGFVIQQLEQSKSEIDPTVVVDQQQEEVQEREQQPTADISSHSISPFTETSSTSHQIIPNTPNQSFNHVELINNQISHTSHNNPPLSVQQPLAAASQQSLLSPEPHHDQSISDTLAHLPPPNLQNNTLATIIAQNAAEFPIADLSTTSGSTILSFWRLNNPPAPLPVTSVPAEPSTLFTAIQNSYRRLFSIQKELDSDIRSPPDTQQGVLQFMWSTLDTFHQLPTYSALQRLYQMSCGLLSPIWKQRPVIPPLDEELTNIAFVSSPDGAVDPDIIHQREWNTRIEEPLRIMLSSFIVLSTFGSFFYSRAAIVRASTKLAKEYFALASDLSSPAVRYKPSISIKPPNTAELTRSSSRFKRLAYFRRRTKELFATYPAVTVLTPLFAAWIGSSAVSLVFNPQAANVFKHARRLSFPDGRTGVVDSVFDNRTLVSYDSPAPHNIKLQLEKEREKLRNKEQKIKEEQRQKRVKHFGQQSATTWQRLFGSNKSDDEEDKDEKQFAAIESRLASDVDENGELIIPRKTKFKTWLHYWYCVVTGKLYHPTVSTERRFFYHVGNVQSVTNPTGVMLPLLAEYHRKLALKQEEQEKQQQQDTEHKKTSTTTATSAPRPPPNFKFVHNLNRSNVFMLLDQQTMPHELDQMYQELNQIYQNQGHIPSVLQDPPAETTPTISDFSGVPLYLVTSPL